MNRGVLSVHVRGRRVPSMRGGVRAGRVTEVVPRNNGLGGPQTSGL